MIAVTADHDHEVLASLFKYQALFKIADQDAVIKHIPSPPPYRGDKSNAEYIRNRTIELYSSNAAEES